MARYPIEVQLTGEDGNAYAIMGRVQAAMNRAGLRDEAKEYVAACLAAQSYDELLRITMETVEVL